MDTHQESPKRPNSLARFAAAAAIAVGLGVGSYGIASAASGSGTTSTSDGDELGAGGTARSERRRAVGPPAQRRDAADG